MPKIILFNGPPRSGKDTACAFAMQRIGYRAVHYRFAEPLKDAVHGLFGMAGILTEHFDSVKDVPTELFFGMTPREAYIWMSEEAAKKKFGKDFFTRVAINHLQKYNHQVIVISDCGFEEEAAGLTRAFGAENVAIVKLRRDGTSFQNDSRSYITSVHCQEYVIDNNWTLDDLLSEIDRILKHFAHAD